MSNPLKRLLNPVEEYQTPSNYGSIMTDPVEGFDPYIFSQPNTEQYYDEYAAYGPRQSEYLGPSHMNPESEIPIMEAANSLPELLSLMMPGVGINISNDMLDMEDADYNLTGAVANWETSIATPNSFESSQQTPLSTQETSYSSSLIPYSTQTESESSVSTTEGEVDHDEEIICYGMLYNVEVKLVGEIQAIDGKLSRNESIFQHFKVKEHQDHFMLRFPDDDMDFGYLRSGVGKTLLPLLATRDVEFEPNRPTSRLRETIGRAKKTAEAIVKVDVNVYGPRRRASSVGQALSDGKLWLQQPDHPRRGVPCENPHFLPIKINGVQVQSIQPDNVVSNDGAAKKQSREQHLRKMVEEVYKSVNNRQHEVADGGSMVSQTLLRHQREALGFMLERESGHINEGYRLWEMVGSEGERKEYRHRITKTRQYDKQPDEKGGGILADEMGMGKSLSILALVTKTLEDGQNWAVQENAKAESNRGPKHSRSTLVVVSSALLIYNWMNEIDKHLTKGVKVIKYHGSHRPRRLDIIQDSDIVVTTYNTLTAEYQTKAEPSILHQIGWYRVVLDEAHIIRRPATNFFQACRDLHANSRWCLTGTPIQNKLADIGTLFAFIRAEPFTRPAVFRKWIEVPFEQSEQSAENPTVVKNRLIMLLEALCLRRTKEVIKLPGTKQIVRTLEFSPAEREQYEMTKKVLMRTIRHRAGDAEKSSKFGLFQANLQMRILCNHGTYQRPFSWHRKSYRDQDAREALICAMGQNAEATCSVCQQQMPILGSSRLSSRFAEQCLHILCLDCTKELTTREDGSNRNLSCPVCEQWKKPAARSQVGASGDVVMSDAPAKRSAEDDDETYFNPDGHSTKMRALIQDVKKDLWITKSIIFSCWTRTLHLLSRHLEDAEIPYLRVDGDCPPLQRQQMLDRFDRETAQEMPVLILTTGTGAFGLNLTCANRVFIVELQWNPAVESQAIARAIRLGQDREVLVTRYVIKDTVEEDMRSQQQFKKQLAAIGFEEIPEDAGSPVEMSEA